MQKYYENLDDFDDGSRSPLMDWTIYHVKLAMRFLLALVILFGTCGILEGP